MPNKFCYSHKTYDYYLQFCARKSLALIVYPDLKIVVKAPIATSQEKIDAFLTRKWSWLEKQLSEFKKYQKTPYVHKYLAGESINYLGRQYILEITTGKRESVKMAGRKIIISTTKTITNSSHNKLILDIWLDSRREVIFKQQFVKAWREFNYDQLPRLKIHNLDRRWGSCSKSGRVITLNPKLIEAPTQAIHYVCVHELSHLKYRHHDKNFYRLMQSHLPTNWQNIKNDLEIRFG